MEKIDRDYVIQKLNEYFESKNSIVRFKGTESKSIEMIITDRYIDSTIINLTSEFYEELEEQLLKLGLNKPYYNNSETTFWCLGKDGIFQWTVKGYDY